MDNHLNLDKEVARYRVRAIVAIQTAFLLGAVVMFFLILGKRVFETTILVSALLSGLSIVLAKRERTLPAAMILGTQFLLLPTFLAFTAQGTYDAVMLLYPAGMMAISVVVKPRQTAVYCLLAVGCAAFVGLATAQRWIGNQTFANLAANNSLDMVATLVIIGFAGVVATYMSVILTGVLRRLADHQATLEEQIVRRTQDLEVSNDELRLAVTNLDKARVELVRGEKLAGLGSLVAGVSHELNTPIGNTAMAASTLQHHVSAFRQQVDAGNLRKSDLLIFLSRCAEGAELIVHSSHRAAELVASFKQVAVDQTSDRRRVFDLDEVFQDVLRSMGPSFKGRDWKIECSIPPGIRCDSYPGPLGQVVTNLVQNALFHGFRDRAHGCVRISAQRLEDEQVEITVVDDGHGVPAETIEKIFDPFFTTRLGQGGSGLGLTIVHNLVTVMLCGRIAVASTVGQGTRFTVTLPLSVPLVEVNGG